MTTKLMLEIDLELADRAIKYTDQTQQTLPEIVEKYFRLLTTQHSRHESVDISPNVMELSGIIPSTLPFDPQEAYTRHITDKYMK